MKTIEEWINHIKSHLLSEGIGDRNASEINERIESYVFSNEIFKSCSIALRMRIIQSMIGEMRGYGLVEPLIMNPEISEIMVNGLDEILVEKNGHIELSGVSFLTQDEVNHFIQKIAGASNRMVNQSSPIVDLRLCTGERVNIVLPPVAINGPIITIRKMKEKLYQIEDFLFECSNLDLIKAFVESLVHNRLNLFVSGGTSSGKTTLLSALASMISCEERVITIEDSAEIQIAHLNNLVKLETKMANLEGTGSIGITELIRTSLRMRPDRIIVGEVRGVEALDMLQAMNTGHDGSFSTGHANSNHDMLYRLETMILGAKAMPIEAVKRQIFTGIDVLIHVRKGNGGKRYIERIQYLSGLSKDGYELVDLYRQSTGGSLMEFDRLPKGKRHFIDK